jgi:hypothetical protein
MEKNKKSKKDYQSTKDYSKKYNKENINIQLNRLLINDLRREFPNQSVKKIIEDLIQNYIKNF